jgi:hypothetical protein
MRSAFRKSAGVVIDPGLRQRLPYGHPWPFLRLRANWVLRSVNPAVLETIFVRIQGFPAHRARPAVPFCESGQRDKVDSDPSVEHCRFEASASPRSSRRLAHVERQARATSGPRRVSPRPHRNSAAARSGRGDAKIKSHLDLGSLAFENIDQDPLAQLGHQLESHAEAGAWNIGCAALALVGDPDAEERSFGAAASSSGRSSVSQWPAPSSTRAAPLTA